MMIASLEGAFPLSFDSHTAEKIDEDLIKIHFEVYCEAICIEIALFESLSKAS